MKPGPINLYVPDVLTQKPRGLTGQKNSFMGFKLRDTSGGAELLIFEGVGEADATPTAVAQVLRQNKSTPVTVRINSPGGFAWHGIAIYNALLAHTAGVTVQIEGIAGSAASVIAMAGRPIRMFAASQLFIHRASGVAQGNMKVMEEVREFLKDLDDVIAGIYSARTGRPKSQMLSFMDGKFDGTTFNAEQATRLGFADEIVGQNKPTKAAAKSPHQMLLDRTDRLLETMKRRRTVGAMN